MRRRVRSRRLHARSIEGARRYSHIAEDGRDGPGTVRQLAKIVDLMDLFVGQNHEALCDISEPELRRMDLGDPVDLLGESFREMLGTL
jgi:hypothetical protein